MMNEKSRSYDWWLELTSSEHMTVFSNICIYADVHDFYWVDVVVKVLELKIWEVEFGFIHLVPTQNFPKKLRFLTPNTLLHLCVLGCKKC